MRKLFSTITLLLAIVSTFYLNSCKKDSFDEEDAMLLQDSIAQSRVRYNLFLTLIDASGNTLIKGDQAQKGVSGASVTFSQDGKLVSKTSDAMGMVTFENVQPGYGAVNIKLDNYSEVNAVLSINNSSSAAGGNQASAIIPMFLTTGSTMASIKGRVTFESDLINIIPDVVPTGTKVVANVSSSSAAISGLTSNSIISQIAFSGLSGQGVTDASGNYSISVPASSEGLDYTVSVPDFAADQNLLMITKNGVTVDGTQTVPTYFGSSFSSTSMTSDIPVVNYYPFVSISAPNYSYTAATATTTIVGGQVTGVTITSGGTGYFPNEVNVVFSAPQTAGGTTAHATATVVNGAITGINFWGWNDTQGSGYTSAPTVSFVSTIVPRTAVATVTAINTNGSIGTINVSDAGEGYLTAPTITVTPHAPAGGSGAVITATVNTTTSAINTPVVYTNRGTGYFVAMNTPSVERAAQSYIITVRGSTTTLRDIYLGTGKRTIEN